MVTVRAGDSQRPLVSVMQRHDDHAAGSLEHFADIAPSFCVAGKIVHVPGIPLIDPVAEFFGAWGRVCSGESDPVEAIFKKEFTKIFR